MTSGREFLVSHPAENPVYTNGPELSDTAYDGGVRLSCGGLPETFCPGGPVAGYVRSEQRLCAHIAWPRGSW